VSGVELPREENRGPTQDLVVLPQPPDLGLQALDLGRLLAGHARTGSVVDLGLGQPAPHGLARDALLTGDRGHRRSHGGVLLGVLAHEPHAPRAQLGIDLLRHAVYPLGLKQQRHQTRDGSDPPRHRERPRPPRRHPPHPPTDGPPARRLRKHLAPSPDRPHHPSIPTPPRRPIRHHPRNAGIPPPDLPRLRRPRLHPTHLLGQPDRPHPGIPPHPPRNRRHNRNPQPPPPLLATPPNENRRLNRHGFSAATLRGRALG